MIDSKKKQFVISLLRRGTMRWKPRTIAKNYGRKQMPSGKGRTPDRPIWHYTCVLCGPEKWYTDKEVIMDHVSPIVDPVIGWVSWDSYVDRMFCAVEGFQRLCKPCHDQKSKSENVIRNVVKKSRKK